VIPVGAPVVRNGTVAVYDTRIEWVGPRDQAPAGDDVELGDAILIPGLVNTHIHLDLPGFAGVLDGRDFPGWLRTLVRGTRELMNASSKSDAALWSVADQLAHGVTTLAHTGPGRGSFDAMRTLGIRGVGFIETFGPDPARCGDSMAALRAAVDAARSDETGLVRVGVSPHAPYSVSDSLYIAVADYARHEGLPVAVHIAESRDETTLVASGSGSFASLLKGRGIGVGPRAASPIALLEKTGILAARPLCIHAVQADDDDIALLADSGSAVAHCPRSNRWFGHGDAPVRKYRAAGVTLGLGTDSAASNFDVRLLAEARDAADSTLAHQERLELATAGGAAALGLSGITGAIRPGLQADLTAFAVDDPVSCDADPAGYLLNRCAGDPAMITVVAGAVRARHGSAPGINQGVAGRVAELRTRVAEWAAANTPN